MAVDTKTVQNRRELKFTSFDEVLADGEKLVSAPNITMLGNWPLAQLFTHLALAIDKSIDGISVKAPWYFRVVGFFIKGRILKHGMRPGFNLPKDVEVGFFPAAASAREGLETFRNSAARLHTEKMTASHPVFGKLTDEEWRQLHLRHGELHLSFAIPS